MNQELLSLLKDMKKNSKIMILLRGLPGASKSTTADEIKELYPKTIICSADHYFIKNGIYTFNRDKLGLAHALCKEKFKNAIDNDDEIVIVDNTNLTRKECLPYVKYATQKEYFIIIKSFPVIDLDVLVARNKHGVTREILEKMVTRYEPDLTVEKILNPY